MFADCSFCRNILFYYNSMFTDCLPTKTDVSITIQCALTVPVAETDVSITIQCSLIVLFAETDVSITIQCLLTVPVTETDVSIAM